MSIQKELENLIKNESQAKKFMEDHFGKKVLKFDEIKKEMLF